MTSLAVTSLAVTGAGSPRGRGAQDRDDRGSTLPLILGFFLIALLMVAASVTLGQAFAQQRNLQDTCDGAAAAAAASSADLDRGGSVAQGGSLQFSDVTAQVQAYLARDPSRAGVTVRAVLSADRERITLTCRQTLELPLGGFFGRKRQRHTATSSARAAVVQ